MRYSNILFDLDGTLTDPALGITNSIIYALKHFDIQVKERSSLYRFIGPPLIDSFKEFYGFSHNDAEKALELYREYFSQKGIFENSIYDGIEELVKKLKQEGARLCLATSKPEVYAVKILEHFKIDGYFDFVAGNTLNEDRPKKSDVLIYLKDRFPDMTPQNTIMVGDRSYDIIGAHEVGFKCIAVLYGYGDSKEFTESGADFIADSVCELSSFLL